MKEVLYDEKSIINLQMFGIEIPALKSRKTKTIEALLADSELFQLKDQWLTIENPYNITKEDLERIHTERYIQSLFSKNPDACLKKAYELVNPDGSLNRYKPENAKAPLSDLLKQVLNSCAGTYYSTRKALETGFCYYMGGGLHHGHGDFGHGFCPTNDIMIAAVRILAEKRAEKIWIIDVDAHKGDGTADMAGNFDSIKTLSVHMADGWPLDEPEFDAQGNFNRAYCKSDIDIELKSGEENSYIPRMTAGLSQMEERYGKPDLAIILLGVDPYEKDELRSTETLKLTEEQMLERDKKIFDFLNSRKISSAYTMAGGYGSFSWEAHYNFLNWVLKKGFLPQMTGNHGIKKRGFCQ